MYKSVCTQEWLDQKKVENQNTKKPVNQGYEMLNSPEARKMRQVKTYYNGPVENAINPDNPFDYYNMRTIGRVGTNYDLRLEPPAK